MPFFGFKLIKQISVTGIPNPSLDRLYICAHLNKNDWQISQKKKRKPFHRRLYLTTDCFYFAFICGMVWFGKCEITSSPRKTDRLYLWSMEPCLQLCHPHFLCPCPSLLFSVYICGNVYKSWNLCPCWKTWFAVYSPPLKEIRPVSPDASQGTDADSIRFLNTDPNNKSRLDWVWIGLAHLNAICLTHSWPVCSMQALNLNQSLSAIKWNNGGVERALKLGLEARLAP